ncbi:MAG: Gfo/Idh/MocA family oxidoreductase [Planctomycetes bacterium]|nr:Gfo/Idh/MocA family oxidoreductase [Planctomycetota bacterium]
MRVLLLGASRLARRRLIPALSRLEGVERLDVATRTRPADLRLPVGIPAAVHPDYEVALRSLAPDLVYVSLVNSLHARWAGAALEAGAHVVVDKPLGVSRREAEGLARLSERAGRLLAEATVWPYHPQVRRVLETFREAGSAPTRIECCFAFPGVPPGDFRLRGELGGGALLDLGPYAVSPGRVLFEAEPLAVDCRVLARDAATGVETAFAVVATYPGGRGLAGHFGIAGTEYRNRLAAVGPRLSVEWDRAYTTPEGLANLLRVRRRDEEGTVAAPAADAFECFLRAVLSAVREGRPEGFREALLADARALDVLRRSAARSRQTITA